MVVVVGRRLARLLVVVGLMGAMLLPVVGSAGSWSVSRLSGSDRFGTAVAVSQEMYPSGADRVYVAYGYGFPDALAAGGGLPGPVLLTRQDSVPGSVVAEIQRLDPAEVFIVGGPGVIDPAVVSQLGSAGSWSVSRLSGSDRFGTAVAVSQEMYPSGADRVYVAYGYGFPDALAAGGGLPGPVLLTRQDSVPGSVVAEIQRLDPAEVFIVGGPGVIDPAVVSQLTNAAPPSTSTTTTTTTVPALTEREILEALYNATDGDNWNTNTGWLSAGDACDWYGITCVNGDVTGISLNSNNLVGTIPSELGNLTALTTLSLAGNQLSGTIPSELGNLTALTNLWLYGNQLSGAIPSELGNLTNLTVLYLSGNQLSGAIPSELGNLTALTTLWLYDNQLSGTIPSELGNLTNLTVLYLSGNQLSGTIPSELGNLTALTTLSLAGNQLSGTIPSELGNLTNLTALYLFSNQLSGAIPSELGNLTGLTNLRLYGNQLSGAIPAELGNLTNLKALYLSFNQLTGTIPSELGNLTNLTNLYLSDNQLTGTVPTAFKDLDSLQYLVLRNNDLSGVLPDQLLELQDTVTLLELYGQSGCLTAASPGLATWLGSLDTNWNDGCP